MEFMCIWLWGPSSVILSERLAEKVSPPPFIGPVRPTPSRGFLHPTCTKKSECVRRFQNLAAPPPHREGHRARPKKGLQTRHSRRKSQYFTAIASPATATGDDGPQKVNSKNTRRETGVLSTDTHTHEAARVSARLWVIIFHLAERAFYGVEVLGPRDTWPCDGCLPTAARRPWGGADGE